MIGPGEWIKLSRPCVGHVKIAHDSYQDSATASQRDHRLGLGAPPQDDRARRVEADDAANILAKINAKNRILRARSSLRTAGEPTRHPAMQAARSTSPPFAFAMNRAGHRWSTMMSIETGSRLTSVRQLANYLLTLPFLSASRN
jgi:hypothetical protein